MLFMIGGVITENRAKNWTDEKNENCKVCKNHLEYMRHMFTKCVKVVKFWKRVIKFIIKLKEPTGIISENIITIEEFQNRNNVLTDSIPQNKTWEAFAIFEIYRAKVELALSNTCATPTEMFYRFLNELKQFIKFECKIRTITTNPIG
ncbi:hypothetical protein BB558_006645, partial [Smittium angustum]